MQNSDSYFQNIFQESKKQKIQKTMFLMHFSHSHAHFIKFWIFQTQKKN